MNGHGLSRREVIGAGLAAGLIGRLVPTRAVARLREADLREILLELLAKHRTPGAVVGVYQNGRVTAAGAGIANLNTGVEMTADTAYLTGSITKVWTTSLLMTFVDAGAIELDRPLIAYLPHFRVADAEVTRTLTAKHLVNHSSGIDAGDLLLEVGEGPEAHRRYVEALATVGQIHQIGKYSSYCNGGFILAGHLLEFVSKKGWDVLLRERLIGPLGLSRTVTDSDDAILQRTAIGSVPDPNNPGSHIPTPKFLLPKSAAPAGATLITTVNDNLEFAAMHLRRGTARSGARVLSEASAKAMATRTIGRPGGGGGFGLGWGTAGSAAAPRLSHSGGSNGGIAQLVLYPEAGVAYAAFANSSMGYGFHGELQRRVMATVFPEDPAFAGPPPAPPQRALGAAPPAAGRAERQRILGSYRRKTQIITIREDGAKLMAEIKMIPEESQWSEAYMTGQQRVFEVVATSDTELVSVEPVLLGQPYAISFLEPAADGRFDLAYSAGRLARRLS
jgi:CubicO group peptidase (beta-lactamase class C family)